MAVPYGSYPGYPAMPGAPPPYPMMPPAQHMPGAAPAFGGGVKGGGGHFPPQTLKGGFVPGGYPPMGMIPPQAQAPPKKPGNAVLTYDDREDCLFVKVRETGSHVAQVGGGHGERRSLDQITGELEGVIDLLNGVGLNDDPTESEEKKSARRANRRGLRDMLGGAASSGHQKIVHAKNLPLLAEVFYLEPLSAFEQATHKVYKSAVQYLFSFSPYNSRYSKMSREKRGSFVSAKFPLVIDEARGVDVRCRGSGGRVRMELRSAVLHLGETLEGGHYVALVRREVPAGAAGAGGVGPGAGSSYVMDGKDGRMWGMGGGDINMGGAQQHAGSGSIGNQQQQQSDQAVAIQIHSSESGENNPYDDPYADVGAADVGHYESEEGQPLLGGGGNYPTVATLPTSTMLPAPAAYPPMVDDLTTQHNAGMALTPTPGAPATAFQQNNAATSIPLGAGSTGAATSNYISQWYRVSDLSVTKITEFEAITQLADGVLFCYERSYASLAGEEVIVPAPAEVLVQPASGSGSHGAEAAGGGGHGGDLLHGGLGSSQPNTMSQFQPSLFPVIEQQQGSYNDILPPAATTPEVPNDDRSLSRCEIDCVDVPCAADDDEVVM